MRRDSASDPWDEVEGLPWRVQEYRTPPEKEQPWETTLNEIVWVIMWLDEDLFDIRVHIEQAFDCYIEENIAKRVGRPSPRAEFRIFDLIRDVVEGRIRRQDTVRKLVLRLLQKVEREVRDTLQASQSGHDD